MWEVFELKEMSAPDEKTDGVEAEDELSEGVTEVERGGKRGP